MNPTDENEIKHILMSLPSKKTSDYNNLSQLDVKLFGEQIKFIFGYINKQVNS